MGFFAIFMMINIAVIVICRALTYWMKNRERIISSVNERKSNNTLSLSLSSERINAFLAQDNQVDQAYKDAREFFESVQLLFDNNAWVVTSPEVTFKSKNRTKDTLLVAKGVCDLYLSDELFYTLEFTRSNIPTNGSIEIKQNVSQEYSRVKINLDSEYGLFEKKPVRKTEGRFRHYEIQIGENHYLYGNTYVRQVAGEKPIEKDKNNYDLLVELANCIEGDEKKQLSEIITGLDKSFKYAATNKESLSKVWDFVDKYIPTIIDSINSFLLDKSEESRGKLAHTLKVMSSATNNFYSKLIESHVDMTEVNQTVLEQQLIREGLFNPYDDYEE